MQQAQDAYNQNQLALQQQQAFVQALQGQNGIQNQSDVFNQIQSVANGTGPNPAQAMLNQATGANVANQASLMAGQRGAGQNVGLIARQAAQQGAATQQQAAGQGATMQANQSLAALGQLSGIAGQQVGQQAAATSAATQAQQNEQQQLLNNMAAANATRAGLQSNINSSNAGLAGQVMTGQQNLIGNVTGGVGSAFGLAKGGEVPRKGYAEGGGTYADPMTDPNNPFNQAPVAPMTPSVPTPTQQTVTPQPSGPKSRVGQFHFNGNIGNKPDQTQQPGTAVAGQAIGKGIGMGLKKLFGPSDVTNQSAPTGQYQHPIGPDTESQSDYKIYQHNQAMSAPQPTPAPMDVDETGKPKNDPNSQGLLAPNVQDAFKRGQENMADGGKVPAMVSPGEGYLDRKAINEVKKGAKPLEVAEKIPGKPKHPGDNYANDTVPKTLESGGVVIPNSIMEKPKSVRDKKSEEFVRQYLASGGRVKGMVIFSSKKARK